MGGPYPCSGPLRCESVLKLGPAELLLTHLPGRSHVDGKGRVWSRDLGADLKALRDWGAEAIICLVEPQELIAMGVPDYADAVQEHALTLFHLPVTDMSTPGPAFDEAWTRHASELESLLSRPSRLAIHCAAGLGRTGMISATLLVRYGSAADDAITEVRRVRPGAIETSAQEKYVLRASNALPR